MVDWPGCPWSSVFPNEVGEVTHAYVKASTTDDATSCAGLSNTDCWLTGPDIEVDAVSSV